MTINLPVDTIDTLDICHTLVAAYASRNVTNAAALSHAIWHIKLCLDELVAKERSTRTSGPRPEPQGRDALLAEQSITYDYVTCLECQEHYILLSDRHLKLHGLTQRTYKAKWGFKRGTKLVCGELSARRRQIATEQNLSNGVVAYQKNRKQRR